jgi:hypothetical protein
MNEQIDSQNLDVNEKLNIIFKEILGFPCTSENNNYYEELQTNFNTYTFGENILADNITQNPDFDINGTARNAEELGLISSNFYDYSYNPLNKSQCSIVDDSTKTVRRFKFLILEQTFGTENSNYGASWFKTDSSRNNVLEDSLQYNYKLYYDIENDNALRLPYLYEVFTEKSLRQPFMSLRKLPFGPDGGNWIYNYKNGILFFSDFNNLKANIEGGIYNIADTNKPVISVYKYIGRKNISTSLNNSFNQLTNSVNNNLIKVFTYAVKLSHKMDNLIQLFNNNTNYSNKIFFDTTSQDFSTNTTALIDLSNSFYNTIIPTRDNTNILVTVNATLYCSYGANERITIQIWRDLSMIIENINIGSAKAMDGLTIPYNYTHLDENISSGLKKYFLKYKLESFSNQNHPKQGIINVRTSQSQGSSDILLREIIKMPSIVDFTIKLLFDSTMMFVTNTSNIIDLSNSFFNVINPCNSNYILVNINATITCSFAYNENITIQLWRDTTMIFENNNIGSINATGGFTFPYSITYLDENHNNDQKKYYLKYKLQKGGGNRNDGIVNVRTSTINGSGSSNFILQEYRNMSNNNINTSDISYSIVDAKTISTNLIDLSNIVYQTIDTCNDSNIIVSINVTLSCSYAHNETITIELWRDNTIILRDSSLGTINSSGGLTFPYNVTYLDANVSNGIKKYYLKYKMDNNNSNGLVAQGLINIKTSELYGSPNILLREMSHGSPIYNKIFYDSASFTTTTSDLIDLSDSFFNTITLSNNNANIMININVALLCCFNHDETINIELWRDLSMIMQDSDLGIIIGTGGFTIPYNLTYLDTNVNSGTIKYYIKYKLKNNNSAKHMGLVNISYYNSIGSSSFFLRQI